MHQQFYQADLFISKQAGTELSRLIAATDEEQIIAEKVRFKNTPEYMDRYWEQAASLAPCFVMTAYQVPRYFKLYAPQGEPDNFEVERFGSETD